MQHFKTITVMVNILKIIKSDEINFDLDDLSQLDNEEDKIKDDVSRKSCASSLQNEGKLI
jgi:hypothetical protein